MQQQKTHILILILIIICISSFQITVPCEDEAKFFLTSALTINELGFPYLYWGEGRISKFMGHPPGFNYIVAGFVKCMGISPLALRFFNLLCAIAAMILFYTILIETKHQKNNAFIFTLLCYLCPYTNRMLMIVDPDTSILPVLSLAAVLLIIKENYLYSGIMIALLSLFKITQPIFMTFTFFLIVSAKKNIASSLKMSFQLMLFTALIHAIIVIPYNLWFKIPVFSNIQYASNAIKENGHTIADFLSGVTDFFSWSGPAFCLVAAGFFLFRAKNSQKRIMQRMFVSGFVPFIIYLVFRSASIDIPKYELSAFLLCMVSAFYLFRSVEIQGKYAGLVMIFTGYFWTFGDIILKRRIALSSYHPNPDWSIFANNSLNTPVLLMYLLPFAAIFLPVLKKMRPALLLIMISAANLAVTLHCTMADYSTGYFYGEKGMDTAVLILENYNDYEIFTRDDVGINTLKRFQTYEHNPFLTHDNKNNESYREKRVKILCISEFLRPLTPDEHSRFKNAGFVQTGKHGDFAFFERKITNH